MSRLSSFIDLHVMFFSKKICDPYFPNDKASPDYTQCSSQLTDEAFTSPFEPPGAFVCRL